MAAVETEEGEAALQLLASYRRGHTETTVVSAVNLCNCLDKCNCIHPHSYTYIYMVHTYANAFSMCVHSAPLGIEVISAPNPLEKQPKAAEA